MSTNMNISSKTSNETKCKSGREPSHMKTKGKLSRVASVLYARNLRRYTLFSLTAAITGMTVTCSRQDAMLSNNLFYDNVQRYIDLTGDDSLDEIDRQQMNLNNMDQAIVSATCVRALSVIAAGCEEQVLKVDVDEIPINPTKPLLQLNINGQSVISCKLQKSSSKQTSSGELSHQGQRTLITPNETCRQRRNAKRLQVFLEKKNKMKDDTRVSMSIASDKISAGCMDGIQSKEILSPSNDGKQPPLVRKEVGFNQLKDICEIKSKSFEIDIIEDDQYRKRAFKSCRSFMCTKVNDSKYIDGQRRGICPCFSPLSTSLMRSELGMLKYLINNLTVVNKLTFGEAVVYECKTSRFKPGISF